MGLALGASYERGRGFRSPNSTALLLWFGWALSYGVVYSYAGGIFHAYYLSTMAPPLAALAGIGVVASSREYLRGGWRVVLLPAALIVTAGWQTYVQAPFLGWTLDPSRGRLTAMLAAAAASAGDWRTWLLAALIGGTLVVALGLLLLALLGAPAPPARRATALLVTVGLAALLVTPSAWALSTVLVRGNVVLPSADLSALTPSADGARPFFGGGFSRTATQRLTGFLVANRHGERFLFASTSTRLAAPIIVATGESVMARGGFFGRDPILTPERLARMVEAGQVRFVMVGDAPFISRRLGADEAARPIAEWVHAKGRLVDPALWRSSALGGRRNGMRLYDLRPTP